MMEEKPKKYAIEVVPLIPLPLLREPFFTYEYPGLIATGSLVRIPFGKRNIRGVVSKADEMRRPLPFKTRPVSAIIANHFLTPIQIELARYIGESYFTPLGIVLKHFLPKQTTERQQKNKISKSLIPLPKLSVSQRKISTALMKEKRSHYLPASLEEKTALLLSLAKKTMAKKSEQILILVPDMLLARELFETFATYFDLSLLALITSSLSDGTYYTYWESIRNGQARIIIGTRQALFAPFGNLRTVLLDFDGHDGYKQWDMMPRYEGRSVAQHLALLHDANFITVSPMPTLQTLFEHDAEQIPIRGANIFDSKQVRSNIILSDLKLDRYKKNFSPFSLLTIEHIREARARGERVLLIVNRQGTSIFSVCERCKEVLRCPNCERALVGTKSGSYRCLHCSYHTKEFPSCPNCKGINFKNIGFGTEKLERELKRVFPHARIRRLDAASRRSKRDEGDILIEAHAGNIDMIVGTEAALLAPSLPGLGLIVLLDGDNALRFPDYQAEERLLRTLAIALGRIAGGKGNSKLIIQTFHSEHPLFRALTGGTMEHIIGTLKQDRTLFSYPPYGTIIKCSIDDVDEKKAEQAIRRATTTLCPHNEEKNSYTVSDPVIPLIPKIRGKYQRFIILRIKGLTIPKGLHQSLRALSAQGFSIDRNPLSLS